ncbi:MAG TPA: DUF87 domain-containing protein, partial [Cyclobacteriaceae bacterium]|nr:DUF87 domain-containing protein [Cyclobacteriaceae bacterium]
METTLVEKIKNGWNHTFAEEIFGDEFIEDNFIITHEGTVAAGFYLELPEKLSMDDNQIEVFLSKMEDVLSRLPAGTSFHFQSQFYERENPIKKLTEKGFITKNLISYHGDKKLLYNRVVLYLAFNFKNPRRHNPISTPFSFFKYKSAHPLEDIDRFKSMARNHVQTFLFNCKEIPKFSIEQMNDEDLNMEKLKYFNVAFDKLPVGYTNELENKGESVQVGDKTVKFVYLRKTGNLLYSSTPNEQGLETFMAWPLSHYLHFPHVVNFSCIVADNETELKALDQAKRLRVSLTRLQNQDDILIANDIGQFTERVRSTGKRLCYMNHNIMVWNSDPQALSIHIDLVKSAYMKMNSSIGVTDAFKTGLYFHSNSPGHSLEAFNTNTIPLDEALCHFDFTRAYPGDGRGIIMNNSDGDPVLVDLWSGMDAFNRVIIAPTGGGKSFLMNDILSQEIEQGIEMVLIDVGGSYSNLLEIYKDRGAKYFEYTEDSPFSFNPFLLNKDPFGAYLLTDEKIMFLTTLITCIWKKVDEGAGLTVEEEAVLTNLLSRYYTKVNEEKLTPRLDSFVSFVEEFRDKNLNTPSFIAEAQFFKYDSFLLCFREYTVGV